MPERYCLIGEHVSRSSSPAMMNAAFAELKMNAEYRAVSLSREEFAVRFPELKRESSGMNVTIPYKSDVIPLVDELDEVSSRIGAVNVIKHSGSKYIGYNTDAGGIVNSLKEHGKGAPRSALLVGAGGAARAFCEAMNELHCASITVVVRDPVRGERFVAEMGRAFPNIRFGFATLPQLAHADTDLIFNATPIGSSEHTLPDQLKRVIYGHATVFDAVYRPMKTDLLKTAELRGCSVIYGYEMLLHQGALAFKIWTGREAPVETMRRALLNSLEAAA